MTILPPNRSSQLNSLVPKGFPYRLRGALLANQDDPFQIPFSGLEPNFLYDLYVNNQRRRSFTSDSSGDLLVTIELDAGADYEILLFPFGGTEFGQKRIWVSVRNWATLHSSTAEMILEQDDDIAIIYDGLRLDTAAIDELNNYHGQNLFQTNDFNYGTRGFRETLRMLRQAYLNEGGSIAGIRNAVSSLAFINPLIKSGRDLSIWWLDEELSQEFRFTSRLTSNDLDTINLSALTGLGTILSSSSNFGLQNVELVEADNLRFSFSADWDGGDITISGTTKFGVEVQEIVFSSPGNVVESNFSYVSATTILKQVQGTAGDVTVGYASVKFVKIINISPFTEPDTSYTLTYQPAPVPNTERFLYNGNIAREQSNGTEGIQTYRIFPPRVEAEVMARSVEPFDLSGNGRYFSFEIDGRGRVELDFDDYIATLSSATAAEVVSAINQELNGRPNYGSSYNASASVVTTTAGDSFKITGGSGALSEIDLNGRDLGSFIKLYYSGNSNDFVDEAFQITLSSTDSSRVFFGKQSDEWFDIEVNYNLKPNSNVSDNFMFLGSDAPDNFEVNGLDIVGFKRTSFSSEKALILEVQTSGWTIERSYPRVLERAGKIITMQMVTSIGNASLSITDPFQLFVSFDNGSSFYSYDFVVGSQPTPNPIGTTNYEMGDYHQTFTTRFYVPIDAVSAIFRIQGDGFTSGDILAIDDISIFDQSINSKFLSRNTVTRGPSYNFLRSELNAWFPERPNTNEKIDIGLEEEEGHIQRVKPSNTIFDRFDATELTNSLATNVVGVWNAQQFDESTLTNFEVFANSPRKSSYIRPTNITDTGIVEIEFGVFQPEASSISLLISSVDDNAIEVVPLSASSTSSLVGDVDDSEVSVVTPVPPVIDFFVVTPISLEAGQDTASISWGVSGSTPLTITVEDNLGNVIYTGSAASSSASDTPATTTVTSYTLTATNTFGSDTTTTPVTVFVENPEATLARVGSGVVHTNDTITLTASTSAGTPPMNWEVVGSALGVVDSGTWNTKGDSDIITTTVVGSPARTEVFTLEVTNAASIDSVTESVGIQTALDLELNGTFSQASSFPFTVSLPTGNDRGLFACLTYDGTDSLPTHAQLGTTIVPFICRSTISTSALPNAERQCAIYYFSESDLSAGTTNNQFRFSDFLTPYTFDFDWDVHFYRATNVGTVTGNPTVLNSTGATVVSPVISSTQYSRVLTLSVAVGNSHNSTTNFTGTTDTNSGSTGSIRTLEAIPNASGNVQFSYTDSSNVSPRVGYCYAIIDPL